MPRTSDQELADMRAELRELRDRIAALDVHLRDYHQRKLRLQTAIARSFPDHMESPDDEWRPGLLVYVLRHSLTGAGERAGLYDELVRLAKHFGPISEERRNLKIEAKGLERAIIRTIEWDAKHPQKQFAFS